MQSATANAALDLDPETSSSALCENDVLIGDRIEEKERRTVNLLKQRNNQQLSALSLADSNLTNQGESCDAIHSPTRSMLSRHPNAPLSRGPIFAPIGSRDANANILDQSEPLTPKTAYKKAVKRCTAELQRKIKLNTSKSGVVVKKSNSSPVDLSEAEKLLNSDQSNPANTSSECLDLLTCVNTVYNVRYESEEDLISFGSGSSDRKVEFDNAEQPEILSPSQSSTYTPRKRKVDENKLLKSILKKNHTSPLPLCSGSPPKLRKVSFADLQTSSEGSAGISSPFESAENQLNQFAASFFTPNSEN